MGLRDAAASTPPPPPPPLPVGTEDWAQVKDGQMKGAVPALRTGLAGGQRQNQTERGKTASGRESKKSQRHGGKGASRVRE